MRELGLAPGTHTVRRSSFSNKLSELPEVDEPTSDSVLTPTSRVSLHSHSHSTKRPSHTDSTKGECITDPMHPFTSTVAAEHAIPPVSYDLDYTKCKFPLTSGLVDSGDLPCPSVTVPQHLRQLDTAIPFIKDGLDGDNAVPHPNQMETAFDDKDNDLPPLSRRRVHTLPSSIMTQNGARQSLCKDHRFGPQWTRRPSIEVKHQRGGSTNNKRLQMNLTQPYVNSEPGRRWSIGSPVSRDAQTRVSSRRRTSKGSVLMLDNCADSNSGNPIKNINNPKDNTKTPDISPRSIRSGKGQIDKKNDRKIFNTNCGGNFGDNNKGKGKGKDENGENSNRMKTKSIEAFSTITTNLDNKADVLDMILDVSNGRNSKVRKDSIDLDHSLQWNEGQGRSVNTRKYSNPEMVMGEKDKIEVLNDPMLNRRWSNPAFAETAKKVNMIIRLGQNMRSRLNPNACKTQQRKTIQTLADLAIDMPKNPRFSTMMSPEAQYSMMMGYEDKIYNGLVNQCPQYQNLLKRNRTPKQNVKIRHKNSIGFLQDTEEDSDSETEHDGDGDDHIDNQTVSEQTSVSPRSSFLTQIDDTEIINAMYTNSITCDKGNGNLISENSERRRYNQQQKLHQHRGSIVSLADSDDNRLPERSESRNTLRSLRRVSVALEKKNFLNKLFDRVNDGADESNISDSSSGALTSLYRTLPRSCSLPNVNSSGLPFNRRLMMTHRLENAMDILDAMRVSQDQQLYLSPRMKARKSVPFVDFSSWVREWNREFLFDNHFNLNT